MMTGMHKCYRIRLSHCIVTFGAFNFTAIFKSLSYKKIVPSLKRNHVSIHLIGNRISSLVFNVVYPLLA